MNVIQYEEVLAEYNHALLNTLRGFTPKYDFISSWVPDADLVLSVISLVESAFSEKTFNFSIIFKEDINIYQVELKQQLSSIADFELIYISSQWHLNIYAMREKNHHISFQINQRFKKKVFNEKENISENHLLNGDDIYCENIVNYARSQQHYRKLDASMLLQPLELVEIFEQNVVLQVVFDDNQIVKALAYQGDLDEVQLGIFEVASQLLVNKPLTEIRDNGLSLVEYTLRQGNARRMAGIQIHFNYSPIFDLLKSCLIKLSKAYSSRKVNTFDIRDSLQLSEIEQADLKKKIHLTIVNYFAEHQLSSQFSIDKIDHKARVTLMLDKELSSVAKSKLLMALEINLRQQVHPAIQVYSTPYVDKNSKRQGHQWAINL